MSLFPDKNLENILKDEDKYRKTPFLFLMASYVRNKSLFWASQNLVYNGRISKGSWMIYSFEK